jgi:hypothetical protein
MSNAIQHYMDIFNLDPKKKKRRLKKSKRQFIIGKHAYVSAGIVFCRHIDGVLHYLLIKRAGDSRFVFEDLGGKIDDKDETLIDLAAREAAEECNAALINRNLEEITKVRSLYDQALTYSIDYIKKLVTLYDVKPMLFPECKYAIYIIPLPNDSTMQDFGDVEIVHDPTNNFAIERTLSWYNQYQLRRINIRDFNPRIRCLVNTVFKGNRNLYS